MIPLPEWPRPPIDPDLSLEENFARRLQAFADWINDQEELVLLWGADDPRVNPSIRALYRKESE